MLTATAEKQNLILLEEFSNYNNSELVGILGNFVNRVVIVNKYWEGKVPEQEVNNHITRSITKRSKMSSKNWQKLC